MNDKLFLQCLIKISIPHFKRNRHCMLDRILFFDKKLLKIHPNLKNILTDQEILFGHEQGYLIKSDPKIARKFVYMLTEKAITQFGDYILSIHKL